MLSLGYELIPLPVHSLRSHQVQVWLYSVGDMLCLSNSWLEHSWAAYHPQVVTSPSKQMGLAGTLHRARARTQYLAWIWANWALGLEKQLIWGSKSGRSTPYQVPWSECVPTWFSRTKLMIGITTWAMQAWTQSAKIRMLVAARPSLLFHHSYIPGVWAPQIPLQAPWGEIRVGTSTE